MPLSPALPGSEATTDTMNVAPVATPTQPSSNGNGIGHRDSSSPVSVPTGRRWWSFSTPGGRS